MGYETLYEKVHLKHAHMNIYKMWVWVWSHRVSLGNRISKHPVKTTAQPRTSIGTGSQNLLASLWEYWCLNEDCIQHESKCSEASGMRLRWMVNALRNFSSNSVCGFRPWSSKSLNWVWRSSSYWWMVKRNHLLPDPSVVPKGLLMPFDHVSESHRDVRATCDDGAALFLAQRCVLPSLGCTWMQKCMSGKRTFHSHQTQHVKCCLVASSTVSLKTPCCSLDHHGLCTCHGGIDANRMNLMRACANMWIYRLSLCLYLCVCDRWTDIKLCLS